MEDHCVYLCYLVLMYLHALFGTITVGIVDHIIQYQLLLFCQQYIVPFIWQHSSVFHSSQLHVTQQQYNRKPLLCFHSNKCYANTPRVN